MKVTPDYKMVIILDGDLPVGLLCNTSAVLSLTIGNQVENLIDKNLEDGDGTIHTGLTNTPLPILKLNINKLKELRIKANENGKDLLIVDITDAAQSTKNYVDYEEKLKSRTSNELKYLGIALAGDKKIINGLTGNLPLLK